MEYNKTYTFKENRNEVGFSSINSFITGDNKNNNNTILAMALAYCMKHKSKQS